MIKAAAYCRVSTDHKDQANSFESQQRYFKEYIDRQPNWELYQVYADEGITGTSTKKRAAFNQMIADAHQGKFQIILTKEVSRFSRNILDTITYTRELRVLNIGVVFVNDGISTLEPDSELRLSIMGSLAQEESRKTSARVKWGQTRQMEQGVVFGRSLLGYDVKGGYLTLNPEGAEVVRLIFHKYGVEKKGTTVIARELREAGYRTYSGNVKWSNSHIVKILKNEKYVGDLVQKKTFTPDYLSHTKKYNHGEEELVIIRNHHEPIIDRKLWNTVQQELKKRDRSSKLGKGHSNRYVFSGKIRCGECGASFVSRKKHRKDGSLYRRWSCYTATSEGRKHVDAQGNEVGCDIGKLLREELAMYILRQSLATLRMDREGIIQNVTSLAFEAIRVSEDGTVDRIEELEYEIGQLNQKKTDVLDAFFSKQITKEEMQLVNQRYDRELEMLQKRLETVRSRGSITYETEQLRETIGHQVTDIVNGRTDSEAFYKNVLDQMVVYKNRKVEVYLNFLSQKWTFMLKNLHQSQNEPSVPMSVSSPLASA